jgi:GT2 family glycosyltransferase/Flp pilus assembly protein TadD
VQGPVQRPFTVTAIISSFNEGDVIYHVIGDLIANGVQVYLLDNCSTDNTVAEASRWLGKGLLHVERFPDDSGYSKRNTKEYVWRDILRRKQELAQKLESDWFIHADADEFRESPFTGQTLSEGIESVDKAGFSAINFELLNFRPVNNQFVPGRDVRKSLTHFERGEWFDSAQIKAWKNTGTAVDLVSTGGHSAGFAGRKVYPVPFILRHYPIRSEKHGQNKVYQERLARFAKEERDAGWHVQYDELVKTKKSFLADEKNLVLYNGETYRTELLGRAKKRIALYRSPHSAEIMKLENILVNVPYDVATLRRLSSLYRTYNAGEFALVLLKRMLEVQPNDAAAQKEIDAINGAGITERTEQGITKAQFFPSIIIPVFNKVELTRSCMQALYSTLSSERFELIIVDNASTDGTKEYLRELQKQQNNVTVIENRSNLGFSKANNIGARAAKGTHLLFLNNDTEPTSGWLDHLSMVYREEDSVGIVGARLLYPNRTIQHAGIEFLPLQQPVHFDGIGKINVVPDHPYRNQPENYPAANIRKSMDMVTGACLLIDAALYKEVGGFNESYLNGCEDIDLCLKVRNKGLQVIYEPKAVVIHHEGQSDGRFAHVRKNLALFFSAWGKQFDPSWKFIPNLGTAKKNKNGEPVIVWEGSQYVKHSLALINREMCVRLAKDNVELSLIPYGNDSYKPAAKDPESILIPYFNKKVDNADIHVRLQWPPKFEAPESGHWVINQPWEFGILPKEWVNIFSRQIDEMWVISSYVRDVYVNSGVPADRVFVVPCGINPELFHPAVKPYKLKTKKAFKFLFVGGTILRKGIDILLDAYTQSFTAADDVCLVIKDMGGDSFYKGMNCKERIASITKQKNAPAIEYIDRMLSDKEIASLYTACDVLVHPYRGEGFGLPILEAMACGTPAIVTNGGASLDFCSAQNSLLINAHKVFYADKRIGEYEMNDRPWLLEPSLDHLKELMVYALRHPSELAGLGVQGNLDAHQHWTWDHAYAILKERIAVLNKKPIKRFEMEKGTDDTSKTLHQDEVIRAIDAVHRFIEEENIVAALNETERIMTMVEQRMNLQHKQKILSDLSALRSLIEQSVQQSYQQSAADPLLETAEHLLSEEKAAEAKILLIEMLRKNPENIDVLNDLAVAGIMEKNYREAAECLHAVVKLDPSNETAIGNLQYLKGILGATLGESAIQAAESLIVDGETAKARIILQEVLLANPEHIDALNDLSVVEIMEKNWREAAVLINKVVTLDPSNESAKQNLQYLDQAVTDLQAASGKKS